MKENNTSRTKLLIFMLSILLIVGFSFLLSSCGKDPNTYVGTDYTITFMNGEEEYYTVAWNSKKTYVFANDKKLKTPAAPEGKHFENWIDSDGNVLERVVSGRTTDIVIYAHFEAPWNYITLDITTNPTRNTVENISSLSIKYNVDAPAFTLETPTCVGYTFNGWHISSSSLSPSISSIALGDSVDYGDMTLYACWDLVEYPINYVSSDSSIEIVSTGLNPTTFNINTAYGGSSSLSAPLVSPTINLYDCASTVAEFHSWYSDSSLNTKITSIDVTTLGSKTVYAKFATKYSDFEFAPISPGSMYFAVTKYKGTADLDSVTFPKSFTETSGNETYTHPIVKLGGTDGKGVFADFIGTTKKLTKITIPEGYETIGSFALAGVNTDEADTPAKYLKTVSLPSTLKTIDTYAFNECTALESIEIDSDKFSTINMWAFKKCTALTNVNIKSKTPSRIMYGAFETCSNLQTFAFEADYDFEEGENSTYAALLFGGADYTLNSAYVGQYAFTGCSHLTTVTLKGFTHLESYAFESCAALKDIYIKGIFLTYYDENAQAAYDSHNPLKISTISNAAFSIANPAPTVTLHIEDYNGTIPDKIGTFGIYAENEYAGAIIVFTTLN